MYPSSIRDWESCAFFRCCKRNPLRLPAAGAGQCTLLQMTQAMKQPAWDIQMIELMKQEASCQHKLSITEGCSLAAS